MRFLAFITLLLFCSTYSIAQKKVSPVKKQIGQKKIKKNLISKSIKPLKNEDLFKSYSILKFYPLVKKSAKKKAINSFLNSEIKVEEKSINGIRINDISFSIYEVEKMKKDDYLYRTFNQSITTQIAELPESFTVHKTNLKDFFGIVQLLNGNIAFPYKGGIIIAQPLLPK